MIAVPQPFDVELDRVAEARELSELSMEYYTGEGDRADGAPVPPTLKRGQR